MSKKIRKSRPFAPWRSDFRLSLLFLLPGAFALYYALHQTPVDLKFMAGGMSLLGLSGRFLQRALERYQGKQLEQASIRSLKLPDGWLVKPNLMLTEGGDVDVFIESPAGDRFAVEIKSLGAVTVKRGLFGLGGEALATASGEKLKDDPRRQALANAQALSAVPVLWLPRASGATERLKSGLILVRGGRRRLMKAIGCRTGWGWW